MDWKILIFGLIGLLFIMMKRKEKDKKSGSKKIRANLENFHDIVYFSTIPFSFSNDMVIVDVGCGKNGTLVKYLREEKGLTNTYGIDLEEVIELIEEDAEEEYFKVGIGESIPFEEESVDVLIFQRTFHHVEDHQKAVSEINRVLKKGGYVVFLEPLSVRGRYEFHTLMDYFHIEDDARDVAYSMIKKGGGERGNDLEYLPYEKLIVETLTYSEFEDIFENMEEFLAHRHEVQAHVDRYSEEDGVEVDDLWFYDTNRVNFWVKK